MVKKLERFGRKNARASMNIRPTARNACGRSCRSTSRPIPNCSTARARTSAPRRTRSRSACSTCSRSIPRAAWKRTYSPTAGRRRRLDHGPGFRAADRRCGQPDRPVGIKKFVAECDDLAKKYGPQFEVPKLLRDMAARGRASMPTTIRPRRLDLPLPSHGGGARLTGRGGTPPRRSSKVSNLESATSCLLLSPSGPAATSPKDGEAMN